MQKKIVQGADIKKTIGLSLHERIKVAKTGGHFKTRRANFRWNGEG